MDSIQRKPFIKNIGKASPKNVSKKHKFHSQEMPLTEKIFCRTFQKGLFLSLPFCLTAILKFFNRSIRSQFICSASI